MKTLRRRSPTIPRLCLPRRRRSVSPKEQVRIDSDMTSSSLEDSGELRGCHSTIEMSSVSLEVPTLRDRHRSSSFDANALRRTDTDVDHLTVPEYSVEASTSESENDLATSLDRNRRKGAFRLRVPSSWHRRRSLELPRRCVHCEYLDSLSSPHGSLLELQTSSNDVTPVNDREVVFGSTSSTSSIASDDITELSDAVDMEASSPNKTILPSSSTCAHRKPPLLRQSEAVTSCSVDSREPTTLKNDDTGNSASNRIHSSIDYCSHYKNTNENMSDNQAIDELRNRTDDDATVVTLCVPPVPKPRASSIDASCLLRQRHVDSPPRDDVTLRIPTQVRASSVEVVLPTAETLGMYRAVARGASTVYVYITRYSCTRLKIQAFAYVLYLLLCC